MPTPADPAADRPTCESCGAPADDTAPVHRVYLMPAGWGPADPGDGEPGADHGGDEGDEVAREHIQVVDDVERWCVACRSHYPHQPIAG